MRRNPDRSCWSCGKQIVDRSSMSACYCKPCSDLRRKEYLVQYYEKAKEGLFQAAAGVCMFGIMAEQQENLERIIALSLMFSLRNKKEFGGMIA